MNNLEGRGFERELQFQASRSGGAGGQNVNKVNTKVELRFQVESSELLSEEEKALVQEKLGNRINSEGYLQVVCQTERSQLQNKELCVQRFYELLRQALTRQKKRKATKPTRSSVRRRLESKKKQSEKKASRGLRGNH
ncbi:alternative ribosome rescue aminoacyl-tRNA hydrolase ArfB [Pontibacter anaerobius]|uniref:Alternative ribosome rescue aminoacyl-tRNA hydrolase ArfB n=1 Tax=Pontibacter anaerobius TaxID=2993940 RepID=A0ABT3RFS5_9BACT|nr:alternative ribosome rescue aminoacyl-tRNA hydrolase ArfB [Pontibacter anaerobius]MCX2740696.1 alternative ribosome rescue aminoacyl-tRNA hydrolase ArfB [Pontibacter anaerobius]